MPVNLYKLIMVIIPVIITGCTGYGIILAPKNPLTKRGRNTSLRSDLYEPGYIKALSEKYEASSEGERMRIRNEIVHRLMAETDDNFLIWSQRVFGARIAGNTLGDATTGILSTIAVGSGAAAAKSLGVAIASISGVRIATDKNLFMEQNASALYSKMKEQRAIVAVQVEQYLDLGTTKYPLNKALRDVERYYEAGTLGTASSRLASDAESDAKVAEAQTEKAKGDKIVAPGIIAHAGLSPTLPSRSPVNSATPEQIAAAIRKANEDAAANDLVSPVKEAASKADFAMKKETPKRVLDWGKVIVAGGGHLGTGTDMCEATKTGLSKFLSSRKFTDDEINAMHTEINRQSGH